ncbi:hypothetical protein Brsp04_00202 [Brucella sp. NBRC 12952]|uniref:AAA domain protein n=1 Tax=Brucella pseudogrignonensis TaxID=419475 RepID=A0A256GDW9_9HYPH|nr:ATP-binding protein [Brucella pseudogrignonensis]EMG54521.1 hypothetical protein WYI_06656 [Ochrobactrum sp. CDB2]NNV21968.1 ATP-binding protein [Brucella pseudogrignonensis]OYR25327.1 AAA domain protein [Brucella pseudogrignonensis]
MSNVLSTFIDGDVGPLTEIRKKLRSQYLATGRDHDLELAYRELMNGRFSGTLPGQEPEGRLLTVTGTTGAGKTMAVDRLLTRDPGGFAAAGRVLRIVAPVPFSLKGLGRCLLAALGYPLLRDLTVTAVWERVDAQLAVQNPALIIIDEIQHADIILKGPTSTVEMEIARLQDRLKSILVGPNRTTNLLLVGLPRSKRLIEQDGQLLRRNQYVNFSPLEPHGEDPVMIGEMIQKYAAVCGVPIVTDLIDDLARRLIHAAGHSLGLTLETAKAAAFHARREGAQSLAPCHFADVYQAVTDAEVTANPFLIHDWRRLNDNMTTIHHETHVDERVVPRSGRPKRAKVRRADR